MRLLSLLGLLCFAACSGTTGADTTTSTGTASSSSSSSGSSGTTGRVCTPRTARACTCGSAQGQQTCASDGSDWGSCACSGTTGTSSTGSTGSSGSTGCTPTRWYVDADHDGYGDMGDPGIEACAAPAGTVGNHDDCNDVYDNAHPGADFSYGAVGPSRLPWDVDCNGQVEVEKLVANAPACRDDAATSCAFPEFIDYTLHGCGETVNVTTCERPAGHCQNGAQGRPITIRCR